MAAPLLKRSDGVLGIVESREEIEQAHHFQRLNRKFGSFEKANGTAALLGRRQVADKHANATGIDGRNFFEIQNDAVLSLAEQFGHCGIEPVEGGPHTETAGELDELNAVHSFGLDIQYRCLHRHELALATLR